jgi:HK97 family phage major capsid protein
MADGKGLGIDGKVKRLTDITSELADLQQKMEADEAENTDENRAKFDELHAEAMAIKADVTRANNLGDLKSFLNDPVRKSKAYGGDAEPLNDEPTQPATIGDAFVNSEAYKAAVKGLTAGDKLHPGQANNIAAELKNFLGFGRKATFDTTSTGLDSSRNYVPGIVMIEQQRLTIRDLLSVGQTTQNIVYFIKESSFTNYADMVAEEGEKPEATLATTTANAPVKKIAVVLKVTDEMFSDFPMLRDYINTRLRFMVEAKEEQQLLNGTGAGNQITGILQTSGIQTQAKGADSNFVAIHKAITKIRTAASSIGGYEPDGIVIHPTDWQILRITTDANTQFYAGGPFQNEYGVGPYPSLPPIWGLRPVVTTAIAAGTALVGAFKLGAQIWQREGIRVDSTNSNEDDFNFNRVTLRVEERLALTVYRPSAFCTVTSIA